MKLNRFFVLMLCMLLFVGGCDVSVIMPPSIPVLTGPLNGTEFKAVPRLMMLSWEESKGVGMITYELEVELRGKLGVWDQENTKILLREEVMDHHFEFKFEGIQPARWRVRAINDAGTSAWSEWSYFGKVVM